MLKLFLIGITLVSLGGYWLYSFIMSVSEGSNFDEDWGSIQHYNKEKFDEIFKKK